MPRVAIAVRAGDEVLGSIWAAVAGPLSAERTEALRDAAKLVALHLLRVRAGADVRRRLRADLRQHGARGRRRRARGARAARPRRPAARWCSASRWRATGDVASADASDGPRAAAARRRPRAAPRRRPPRVGGRAGRRRRLRAAAAVERHAGGGRAARASRLATDFLDRVGDRLARRRRRRAGRRATVPGIADAPDRDRPDPAGAARAARSTSGSPASPTCRPRRCCSSCATSPPRAASSRPAPLARLIGYDARAPHASLVATLRAWLDAFGDVGAGGRVAVRAPEHFRYRLRRVAEVGELDLPDPRQRFAVMLQLAVLGD